ncbi:hypothetical protein [Amnibacterium setariae]|uniref:Uncharacterized protein n=1 Tax=Amnibacterium setariae TaxID=2306585 RepID=A0A3A1TS12_9MICO|nr:hypothetical protein [Amnibacterium setariae]RIX26476.1 hypothetical protein D1781_16200 [Amnibacterium setariae]
MKPKPIASAARSGNRRELLVALRDHIAAQLDEGVGARELAPLSRRLVDVAAEIEAIDAATKSPVADAAQTPDEEWTP